MQSLTKKLITCAVVASFLGFGIYFNNSSKSVDIDSSSRNKAVEVVNEKVVPSVPAVVVGDEGKLEKIDGRAFAVYDGDTCRIELPGG